LFKCGGQGKHASLTTTTCTLGDKISLGTTFKYIKVEGKGLYVTLDVNYEKLFVICGEGLKLVYWEQIGDYVEEAMC